MTDEEIKRAAKLIDEIATLADVLSAKDRKIVIAQQFDGKSKLAQAYAQQCFPIALLSEVDARSLALPILESKRAELNALRDSDIHPKDGDVKQAPPVSGAGPKDIAKRMVDE